MKLNLKKITVFFVSAFFLTAFTYAQELMDEPSVYSETGDEVSQEDSALAAQTTEEASAETTEETKSEIVFKDTNLAKAEKVKSAIGLNLIPGFGCGSFAQGDVKGGTLGAVFSTMIAIGTTGFVVTTLALAIGGGFAGAIGGSLGGDANAIASETMAQGTPYLVTFGVLAGGGLLANIIWGIVRPINYKKNYLSKNGLSLNIAPVISTDRAGAVAVLRF